MPQSAPIHPPTAPAPPTPAAPSFGGRRFAAIDTARGIALLGILFVNAEFFSQPFQQVTDYAPPQEGTASTLAYYFTEIFCTGKFYVLFSLLFGVGLAMMFESARTRGRSATPILARRLLALACFGVAHIVLLWYGDILLMYAIIGCAMVFLIRCSTQTLLVCSGCFMGVAVLLSALWGTVMAFVPETDPAALTRAMPDGATPLIQYFQVFGDPKGASIEDPRLGAIETQIMLEGPFLHALAIRATTYMLGLVFLIVAMAWPVIACFTFGAALVRMRFFQGECPRLERWFLGLGLGVGLPLQVVYAFSIAHAEDSLLAGLGAMLGLTVGGPLLMLAYVTLIMRWVRSGWFGWLARVLANAGRMALTVYLSTSLVMCFLMYHWGLRMFGSTTWGERIVIVLLVWGGLVLLANLWMRAFSMGPLEWLWRACTYWSLPPLRRRADAGGAYGSA